MAFHRRRQSLDRAVRKGLAVRPEDRFADAGEFLDVLKREETVALPRPSGPAGGRGSRRR